jgi:hypothetical protein
MVDTIVATAHCLDQVRELLGQPIIVSSWYRCTLVNAAVGSKSTSQHMKGEAVDFTCPKFGTIQQVFDKIRNSASTIAYDQIIIEFNSWVHISFSKNPRRTALIIDQTGTKVV